MGAQKLQASRALRVIPSDYAEIPFPAVITSGTSTDSSLNQLIDSSATFITNNVKPGDIVYNLTSNVAATVIAVESETSLLLNGTLFFSDLGQLYIVYQASQQNTIGNTGCVLYVGGAGNVNVITIGGDSVIFNAVPAGSFLPIQIKQVLETGTSATLINALW